MILKFYTYKLIYHQSISLWLPSQYGPADLSFLRHPHIEEYFWFFATKGIGLNGVPIWLSSQNGWFFDNPHAQYKYYFPGYNCILWAKYCLIYGFFIAAFS